MRTIWVVRHGDPEIPERKHICLGQISDPHLSNRGKEQAKALKKYFQNMNINAVYCSPLKRSIETAEIIAGSCFPVYCNEALTELDAGKWDGLEFEEIRKIYPVIYELRKTDNSIPPPEGETYESGFIRFRNAIAATQGDCIIVAHAGINRALICGITLIPYSQIFKLLQPTGCINKLIEKCGEIEVHTIGVMPEQYPSNDEILFFMSKCKTPEEVIRHCQATAALADLIAYMLEKKGHLLNRPLLVAAASLHDILRTEPDHAVRGAEFMLQQGYPVVAALISEHQNLKQEHINLLDEYAVLYLADKLVQDDMRITLEVRFANSGKKCESEKAYIAHNRRMEAAFEIRNKIKNITGIEV